MLGENYPVVSPTLEGSDMSYTEQSETPRDNKTPEKTDTSVENQPSAESRQELSPIEERPDGESSSTDGSDGDSAQGQLQSQAMKITLSWCLLCQRLSCRNPSFLLLKQT